MAKVGINLGLLHDEHEPRCVRTYKVAMGYAWFCERYGSDAVANNLTEKIELKVSVACKVDWSGTALGRGLVDPIIGEVTRVHLFRGSSAVRPQGVLRANAQYGRSHVASLPRTRVRVLGQHPEAHGLRQPQGRSRQTPLARKRPFPTTTVRHWASTT